jgi:hypothetical protein
MKFILLLALSLSLSLLTVLASADPSPYAHAVRGFTLSISRGIVLRNDELEASQTKEIALGVEIWPNVLQLRVPFGSCEVDTRGNLLPQGRIRAKSMGASLWLGFGGERWTPFIGTGGSFYSFQEQFKTMGNLENSFGGELYAGLRFRLAENLWDYLKLRGTLHYQTTLLKPSIQVPDHPDTSKISMHRHSVVLTLEAVGL